MGASKQPRMIIAVAAAVVVAAGLAAWLLIGRSPSADSRDDKMVSACQQSASVQLASPDSANFGPMAVEPLTAPGEYTHKISSWVESKNGLGATLRSTVACHLRVDDGGNVQVVSNVTSG
ncbi:MAG: hypothetical protein JWN03_1173 [Nocardia sp.]|uniref:hypothetical protein n=1 Tax=Nocardia sp. TaxID=1821 RepID=UPI0026105B3D|nr:hypothetical protein [Nocardia sp.]MCU1640898.1 hypothetical protein [Nocardia sp.]